MQTVINITLPKWLDIKTLRESHYPEAKDQVYLAIQLANQNVQHQSGGPFGAAVFDRTGNLISVGVNRVEPENNSVAHAEILAIMSAQSVLSMYRLDLIPDLHYTLASSAQPCAMCFGALLWSGITRLLFGATHDDVISLTGFDEGPLPEAWIEECRNRNIRVQGGIHRDMARDCLKDYCANSGTIY